MRSRTVRIVAPAQPHARMKRALAAVIGGATIFAGSVLAAPAAFAAEDVITVTSTDGCATAGSFASALALANASTNADGVRIVFDDALAGTGGIEFADATCRMHDQWIGARGGNHEAPGSLGARFVIDSAVPVSIDFSNLDEIGTSTDADIAGIFVRSDNVRLEHLANLKAGAAGIAIEGSHVTVADITFSDDTSPVAETGVALLDGANDVTIRDSDFMSQYWASILVDGSFSSTNTVSDIVIENITSRGVESGFGHIDIEDGAVVNGMTVTNSTFGALDAETSTTHAVYFNTAVTANDLTFSDNTVLRGAGAEKNVFYFEDATRTTLTDTRIEGNSFTGVSSTKPLSRIIGNNTATWNGLTFADNTASLTRGILMNGTVNDATISGNTFQNTFEPNGAQIQIAAAADNVTVTENTLDTVWAIDAIRVQGTAKDVLIADNTITDFTADGSRSAIAIVATGEGNVVRDNELVQDLDRAGVDLPANMANHWAVYLWAEAGAAAATDQVGWSILNNHIDGFGGEPAILSQGPITDNARGKALITGNTFGQNTRGSIDTETENGGNWFLWNDRADANNRVQTLRAESVSYDGSTATFTAAQPDPLAGNNAAVAPVTLHVYWTADDNAEEYLGSIADVTPGERVSIATTHTDGFVRVQTVDAAGNTSQYSSVDTNTVVAPAAPAVTDTYEDGVAGTGDSGATVEVRDVDGTVVGSAAVGSDGTWRVAGLECGTDYVAVQVIGGVDSAEAPFSTLDCVVVTPPAPPAVTEAEAGAVSGTGVAGATVEIRDSDGTVIATATVAADGTWSVDGLECGTDYVAVQNAGGLGSAETAFSTEDCSVDPGDDGDGTGPGDDGDGTSTGDAGDGSLAVTGSAGAAGIAGLAALLLAVGSAVTVVSRRRRA